MGVNKHRDIPEFVKAFQFTPEFGFTKPIRIRPARETFESALFAISCDFNQTILSKMTEIIKRAEAEDGNERSRTGTR